MPDPLLLLDDVVKTYRPSPWWLRILQRDASTTPVEALRGVSLQVHRGEVLGVIGPNGAGKSTLIKTVAGLVSADSGGVAIDGLHPVRERDHAMRRLGLVLTDERGLYWRLTGRQNLEFFGRLSGLRPKEARARAEELLRQVGLTHRDKLVLGYSAGMKARLSIARALVISPPLLVLDEPTRSLDPIASAETGQLIRDLADAGHGVLLSSHRLDEVTANCDRIIVLIGGRITTALSKAQLQGETAPQLLEILMRDMVST